MIFLNTRVKPNTKIITTNPTAITGVSSNDGGVVVSIGLDVVVVTEVVEGCSVVSDVTINVVVGDCVVMVIVVIAVVVYVVITVGCCVMVLIGKVVVV